MFGVLLHIPVCKRRHSLEEARIALETVLYEGNGSHSDSLSWASRLAVESRLNGRSKTMCVDIHIMFAFIRGCMLLGKLQIPCRRCLGMTYRKGAIDSNGFETACMLCACEDVPAAQSAQSA